MDEVCCGYLVLVSDAPKILPFSKYFSCPSRCSTNSDILLNESKVSTKTELLFAFQALLNKLLFLAWFLEMNYVAPCSN